MATAIISMEFAASPRPTLAEPDAYGHLTIAEIQTGEAQLHRFP